MIPLSSRGTVVLISLLSLFLFTVLIISRISLYCNLPDWENLKNHEIKIFYFEPFPEDELAATSVPRLWFSLHCIYWTQQGIRNVSCSFSVESVSSRCWMIASLPPATSFWMLSSLTPGRHYHGGVVNLQQPKHLWNHSSLWLFLKHIIFTDYNFNHLLVIYLSILTNILRACRNSCV